MFISYSKAYLKILMELLREISYVIYFCYIFSVIHFRMFRIEFNVYSSTRVLHGFSIGNEHREFYMGNVIGSYILSYKFSYVIYWSQFTCTI